MGVLALIAFLLWSTTQANNRPAPVFTDVYIENRGPYRFLVDTGSQTSLIDEKLAAELNLQPAFRVEIITQHSTRLAPARKVAGLRIGQTALPESELVWHNLSELRRVHGRMDGLLGLNALTGLSFGLHPSQGRLELSPTIVPGGDATPYSVLEGRIAVEARMGTETLNLILDSGASHVVLFRTPAAMAKVRPVEMTVGTLEGARSVAPVCWTAQMTLGKQTRIGTLPAAVVNRPGTQASGLLPASAFKAVYVDQSRREVVLVR